MDDRIKLEDYKKHLSPSAIGDVGEYYALIQLKLHGFSVAKCEKNEAHIDLFVKYKDVVSAVQVKTNSDNGRFMLKKGDLLKGDQRDRIFMFVALQDSDEIPIIRVVPCIEIVKYFAAEVNDLAVPDDKILMYPRKRAELGDGGGIAKWAWLKLRPEDYKYMQYWEQYAGAVEKYHFDDHESEIAWDANAAREAKDKLVERFGDWQAVLEIFNGGHAYYDAPGVEEMLLEG